MNLFSKAFFASLIAAVVAICGTVIWNDIVTPENKTFRTGGENVSLSVTKEYEKDKVGGSKFSFMLLSTRDLGNKKIWEKRKGKVIQKLSSEGSGKDWAKGSFFKGIKKGDEDIVKKIMESCRKAYETKTPKDETNEWFFKVPKWKEVFIFCKRD